MQVKLQDESNQSFRESAGSMSSNPVRMKGHHIVFHFFIFALHTPIKHEEGDSQGENLLYCPEKDQEIIMLQSI